jgi:energy-coupling factor transport system ATP-binding protein
VIEIDGLVHVYTSGTRAVDGVSLTIRDGERVAIIGQNGSGKSTLVRHLNGLQRPTEGRIAIDGVDATGKRVAELARTVGIAFQDPDRQIFAGAVRAEVAFGPRNMGLRGDALAAAVDGALAATGLTDDAATNPYDLGYSRRKLLALASVLAMGTPVVVLDEPTTGQDARGVRRVEQIVGDLGAAGRTVIAITHDMRFAAESFERIVVMRAGRVVLDGPPTDVFARSSWDVLTSTYLEPTLEARVGDALGLEATPTTSALIAALTRDASTPAPTGSVPPEDRG